MMASKTTLVCCTCLMFFAHSIVEMAVSGQDCNAKTEVAIYMDVSTKIDYFSYINEKYFVAHLIDRLLPGPNKVSVGVIFYASTTKFSTKPFFKSFDNKQTIKDLVLAEYGAYQLGNGEFELPPLEITTYDFYNWTEKLESRRVAVIIADAVFENHSNDPVWSYLDKMLGEKMTVLAIAVGNDTSLEKLERPYYKTLDLIKVGSFWALNGPQMMDHVLEKGRTLLRLVLTNDPVHDPVYQFMTPVRVSVCKIIT